MAKNIWAFVNKKFAFSGGYFFLITRLKKILDSDWLRAVQFKCYISAKSNTSANYNEDIRRLPKIVQNLPKITKDQTKPSEDFRISPEHFLIFPNITRTFPKISEYQPNTSEDFPILPEYFRRFPKTCDNLRRSFASLGRSRAMPSYLSKQCVVGGFK